MLLYHAQTNPLNMVSLLAQRPKYGCCDRLLTKDGFAAQHIPILIANQGECLFDPSSSMDHKPKNVFALALMLRGASLHP